MAQRDTIIVKGKKKQQKDVFEWPSGLDTSLRCDSEWGLVSLNFCIFAVSIKKKASSLSVVRELCCMLSLF